MGEQTHVRGVRRWGTFPPATLHALTAMGCVRACPPGTLVFEPSARPRNLFLLESGRVRIYRESSEAEELTFGFIHAGDLFGEGVLLGQQARESFAVAEVHSRVRVIKKTALEKAMVDLPDIPLTIARQVERRLKAIESRIEDLTFRSVRARLARMLLGLDQEFGAPGACGNQIRLTHAELANLVGATRPTVTLALAELELRGAIERRQGWIELVDRQKLEREF